jgi:hypothetical protein
MSNINNLTNTIITNNKHTLYNWSNDYHEKFTQFFFQLNRNNNHTQLQNQLDNMISIFKNNSLYHTYLISLYKLIGHTRDIIYGKGEYNLSFMMIFTWYKHFPQLAFFAIKSFVINDTEHPYGSWKDIKYFSNYVFNITNNKNHPLILYSVNLLVKQLKNDYNNMLKKQNISLAAKWCPRENNNKFSWLYLIIAKKYNNNYIKTAKNQYQLNKAYNKTNKELRTILTSLNKYINTTEIYTSSNNWHNINFNNVHSNAIHKYKYAFLNINDKIINDNKTDLIRKLCSINFKKHLINCINKNSNFNSKNLFPYQIISDVIYNYNYNYQLINNNEYRNIIQLQWNNIIQKHKHMGRILPIIDLNQNNLSLYNAIALSIIISQINHHSFRNRILTLNNNNQWINLDNEKNIVDIILKIYKTKKNNNKNIYNPFNLLLNIIQNNNIEPAEVENMQLIIFSNMQFNKINDNTLIENIKNLYEKVGLNTIHKTPYKIPHIIFWNLEYNNNFPILSRNTNTTMMSGFNSIILNEYCYNGTDNLKSLTPYKMIQDLLNHKRYKILEHKILDYLLYTNE